MGSPLWKRGVRGDFVKISDSIGVAVINQPIRLFGLILRLRSGQAPGVCSGLILSGAFYPDLKIGVWRRRTYQGFFENPEHLILLRHPENPVL